MLPHKKTQYNYQDSVLHDYQFQEDQSLKLYVTLSEEMNPGQPHDAQVTFSPIKNFTEVYNFFQNLPKTAVQQSAYDRIHCLVIQSKNSFAITFFENPKLEISARSMIEN